MTTAQSYARALFETETPDFRTLREALMRRGHLKLLPHIFSEYQKLLLQRERSKRYATLTPKTERNRMLIELYRKLIST